MADAIRIVLADDHAVVREGLRAFLELQEGIEVVGEAADGEEAVEEAERLRPDVLLMDLVMPRLDGVGAMRELRRRRPEIRVIVLTSFAEDERLLPAIQAGAAGYLLKNVEPSALARAVRAAHAGETLLPRSVIVGIAQRVAAARDRGSERIPIESLTPRELEVLRALTEGLSTPEICEHLFIAPNTLRTHVQNIMSKLRVHSKLEAVAFALRHRLVEPPRAEDSLY